MTLAEPPAASSAWVEGRPRGGSLPWPTSRCDRRWHMNDENARGDRFWNFSDHVHAVVQSIIELALGRAGPEQG